MKVLYVEWLDSNSRRGGVWHDIDSKPCEMTCKTVGFVIHEDKKSITVASHLSEPTDSMAGDITIPKRAITKRRIVRWKK